MAFEPNRGQFPAAAGYLARARGYALSLSAGRAVLTSRDSRVVTVLVGARTSAPALPEAPLPGVAHYLIGRDPSRWLTNVPTYERVRYRGVYAGVDVLYYGDQGRLEYDFIVAPGADPRHIRLRYQGVRSLRLDSAGDLLLGMAAGDIRQHRPAVYQEVDGARRPVAGRYILRGRSVCFALAPYDRSLPLVIDPALTWATYYHPVAGQATTNTGEAVAVDAAGNTYVTGSMFLGQGYAKAYAVKLSPDGATALYHVYFGGSYDDEAHGIAVDSGGYVYVVGHTNSYDFPYSNVAASPSFNPPYTVGAFIIKLDPTLSTYLYSIILAGSNNDIAQGVALDSATNAFVVGYTQSADFPVTNGAAQTGSGGGWDAFVTGINAAGTGFVYSTYFGGSGNDYGNAIAADAAGNVFITGQAGSANFPVSSSALQSKLAGGSDAFVAKLAAGTGSVVYSTYLGGSGNDFGGAIAIDSGGAVYVAGETASADFPVVNAFQKTFGGGNGDIFVAKLNAAGQSLVYSTFLGGSGEDSAYGLALDTAGDAYLTGASTSTDFPVSDSFQKTNQATLNGVVAALDSSGSALLFSSYLGGTGASGDYGNSVAFGCTSGLVMTGSATSTNFPITSGVLGATYGGGASDAFVARIANTAGTPAITPGGIVNVAAPQPGPVAPGSLISVYGSNLALASLPVPSTPWPTTLAGATLTINGTPAPILFAGPGQINAQVPYEVSPGAAVAVVTLPCGASAPVAFQVAAAAPYLWGAVNPDGSVNGSGQPARAGQYVEVFLTGIGAVNPPLATGAPASATPFSSPAAPYSATIGATSAPVALVLVPTYVGFAQANVLVPALPPGQYPLVITVGGVASNAVTLYVQ